MLNENGFGALDTMGGYADDCGAVADAAVDFNRASGSVPNGVGAFEVIGG